MIGLPDDLKRLPPQVLDVIRYLGQQDDGGADIFDMMDDMGMSERVMRKWLRRLVTRFYAEMPVEGYYMLTPNGQQAVQILRDYDAANPGEAGYVPSPAPAAEAEPVVAAPAASAPVATAPAAAPVAPPPPPPNARHERRLMVVTPKELVAKSGVTLRVGFDQPGMGQPPLNNATQAILRVSAPGCDVRPVERPLDIRPQGTAGPVNFEITPRLAGQVRVKVEVYQLVTLKELVPAGGMYFDLNIASAPTAASVSLQALGAGVGLKV